MTAELQDKMGKTIDNLKSQFTSLRTNRANSDMLSTVTVDYYGATTPLQQVASVSVPEPRMLLVNVFDQNAVKSVEKALMTSSLGLNPQTEGSIIRIRLPELTEERRQDLVKHLRKLAEDSRVAVRHIRRDAVDKLKKEEKDNKLSEDEVKSRQNDIQTVTDKNIKVIDDLTQSKEKEILTV